MECDSPQSAATQSLRLVPSSGQGAPRMGAWSEERQHVPTHHPHPQQLRFPNPAIAPPAPPGQQVILNPNQPTTLVALPTQTLNLAAAAQSIAPLPQQVLITDSPALQTLLVQSTATAPPPGHAHHHPHHPAAPQQGDGSNNPSRQSHNSSVSSSAMTIDLTNLHHQAAVLNAAGLGVGAPGDAPQIHAVAPPAAVDATQVGSVNMQLGGVPAFAHAQPQTTVTAHPGGTQYTTLPPQQPQFISNPTTSFPFTIATTTVGGAPTNMTSQMNSEMTSQGRPTSERSSEESPMTGIVLTQQQSPTVASH